MEKKDIAQQPCLNLRIEDKQNIKNIFTALQVNILLFINVKIIYINT